MRLMWADRALSDLHAVHDRAPRQAQAVVTEVEWLVASPFPGMFRRITGRPRDHVLVVSPHIVIYRVDGDTLVLLRVIDGRRYIDPAADEDA